jgi:hypothetical protein
VQILDPEERHAVELIQLSCSFSDEYDWAGQIPLGQIRSPGKAWVLHRNEVSLAVMPRLRFCPDRILEHDGHQIHVFVQET